MNCDQKYESVWDAVEDTPEAAENMRLRSMMMRHINDVIQSNGWTQEEAAAYFDLTQPRISDLTRGKIALFSLDTLVNLAHKTGAEILLNIDEKSREGQRHQVA